MIYTLYIIKCINTTLIHAACVQRLSARVPGRGGEVAVAAALHDVLRRAQVREEDALGPVRGRGPLPPLLREAAVLACGPRRRYRGVGGHVTRGDTCTLAITSCR